MAGDFCPRPSRPRLHGATCGIQWLAKTAQLISAQYLLRQLDAYGQALRFLLDRIGTDHVLIGSDYRFGMGCDNPVDAILALGLTAAQQHAVAARCRGCSSSDTRGLACQTAS